MAGWSSPLPRASRRAALGAYQPCIPCSRLKAWPQRRCRRPSDRWDISFWNTPYAESRRYRSGFRPHVGDLRSFEDQEPGLNAEDVKGFRARNGGFQHWRRGKELRMRSRESDRAILRQMSFNSVVCYQVAAKINRALNGMFYGRRVLQADGTKTGLVQSVPTESGGHVC
jgi:hypothetical protein